MSGPVEEKKSRWAKFGFPDTRGVPLYLPFAGLYLALLERWAIVNEELPVPNSYLIPGNIYFGNFTARYPFYGAGWDRAPISAFGSFDKYIDYMEPIVTIAFQRRNYYNDTWERMISTVFEMWTTWCNVSKLIAFHGMDFIIEYIADIVEYKTPEYIESIGIGEFFNNERDGWYYRLYDAFMDKMRFYPQGIILNILYKMVNSISYLKLVNRCYGWKWQRRSYSDISYDEFISKPWKEGNCTFFTGLFGSYYGDLRGIQQYPVSKEINGEPHSLLKRKPDLYLYNTSFYKQDESYQLDSMETNIQIGNFIHCKKNPDITFADIPPLRRPNVSIQKIVVPSVIAYLAGDTSYNFTGVFDCKIDLQFYDEDTGDVPNYTVVDNPANGPDTLSTNATLQGRASRANGHIPYLLVYGSGYPPLPSPQEEEIPIPPPEE